MKWLLSSLFFLSSLAVFAQLNLDSVGHVNYSVLHNTGLNDIWGYVDENNNEYALVGGVDGTSIVDVTDPATATEVFWEPGMNSIWRDLKTFGDYAYVTTEALNGLLIIDLSPLPSSTALTTSYYFGEVGSEWESAHNLYVDSLGYAYIFGANRGNGGVIILDIATDPMNPVEVGVFDNWYVHDGFVLGDTMYLAHISDGIISIVDVSDRSNPVLLGTQTTPSSFAHNIWPSADGQYVYTTDELPFSYVTSFDVSDPTNIIELDRIQSSPGTGTIPHNVHVFGDYIVTSHYTDGVVVHDVTYPYNMIEVGDYDTHPFQTDTYDGCWGAYPFLPSGLLLATDRSEGLFLLEPTYTKAAYLEGIITDELTNAPLDLANVTIEGDDHSDDSNPTGFYATGVSTGAIYNVTYSKIGYFPETIQTALVNGIVTTQNVELTPIPPYSLTVKVQDGSGNPIIGAEISLQASVVGYEASTNGLGSHNFTLFYQEPYNVIVGKWGYITTCFTQEINQTTNEIIVTLEAGIYDDFTFDFGWVTSNFATTGHWERGKPNATTAMSSPVADVPFDCGNAAFVTGNALNVGVDADDVDGGEVTLISPIIDLSGFSDPYVNYARWFYCYFGPNTPDDSLRVTVSNGTSVAEIDVIGSVTSTFGAWQYKQIRLLDFITLTPTMQFFFQTSDLDPDINITEAGLDLFFINESSVGIEELNLAQIEAYPNPTDGSVKLSNITAEMEYQLLNANGQVLEFGKVDQFNTSIDVNRFENGMYFIRIADQMVKIFKTK